MNATMVWIKGKEEELAALEELNNSFQMLEQAATKIEVISLFYGIYFAI